MTVWHGVQIGATNTGPVGAGLAYADLTPSGTVTTSADGQIIDGLDVHGAVLVRHNNVTIRNCRIDGGGAARYCVDFASGSPVIGTRVEWCELVGASSAGIVHYSPWTLYRCDLHSHAADAIKAGSNCLVLECYVHDFTAAAGAHNDGVQIVAAPDGPVVIRRSRIEGRWQEETSAIIAQPYNDTIAGLVVEDNLLGGGTFTLYTLGEGYQHPFATRPEIHGNYFAGVDAQPAASPPGNSWKYGPRQSSTACNESGNFYVPLLPDRGPWAVDVGSRVGRD